MKKKYIELRVVISTALLRKTALLGTARILHIKEGFNLRKRFVEMGLGGHLIKKKKGNGQMGKGSEIALKTEQVRKNVVFESLGQKPINLWSFVMTRFIGKNRYKTFQCKKLN